MAQYPLKPVEQKVYLQTNQGHCPLLITEKGYVLKSKE